MRQTTTPAAKEMANKLAEMRAEREKQDAMWNENLSSEKWPQGSQKEAPPSQESLLHGERKR